MGDNNLCWRPDINIVAVPKIVFMEGISQRRVFFAHAWADFHMLFDLVEWHLKLALSCIARTEDFPEQADFLVAFQLRKIEQLTTAFVLTLVLDLFDQPGGDQGIPATGVSNGMAGGADLILQGNTLLHTARRGSTPRRWCCPCAR